MSSPQAILNKILTYSVVDGPGNRLVLFFQGCNFNCPTCHNPYTVGVCNHCGDCVSSCHVDALSMHDGKIQFDPTPCDQCDACLEACPISASPMVAQYSVIQILDIARKHKPFLSGITVSGGEATLQIKFIHALFSAIKADSQLADLTCFIDTNGHLGAKSWKNILPVTDGVMLDIKAFSPDLHADLTGQNNHKTLASAKIIDEANKLYELRLLMIPGKTNSDNELDRLIEYLHTLSPDVRIKLNAFQHHGVRGEALNWPRMGEAEIDAVAARLTRAGVKTVITPTIYQ